MSPASDTGRLELRAITAGYGPVTVLRSVDLVVPAGRVVALLGPNGAGKTTLMRVASGLLRPERGAIRASGRTLTGRPAIEFARSGICHVPEGAGIFRTLSVRDNLELQRSGDPHSGDLDRVFELFPRLRQRLDQIAGTMSGGEQRMLALARALLARPSVILLDEPSLGLAPLVIDEVYSAMSALRRDGAALVIVEQFVDRALAMADFVYLMARGRIVEAGEASEYDPTRLHELYLATA